MWRGFDECDSLRCVVLRWIVVVTGCRPTLPESSSKEILKANRPESTGPGRTKYLPYPSQSRHQIKETRKDPQTHGKHLPSGHGTLQNQMTARRPLVPSSPLTRLRGALPVPALCALLFGRASFLLEKRGYKLFSLMFRIFSRGGSPWAGLVGWKTGYAYRPSHVCSSGPRCLPYSSFPLVSRQRTPHARA